jgi:enterochelin esterase-like enzyme
VAILEAVMDAGRTLALPGRRRVGWWPVVAVVAALLVAGGALGTYRYIDNYWLYRGFDPPRDPNFVKALGDVGTTQRFYVTSAALGGRSQAVDVYLPPGYSAHPNRRYPVFYLLHGFPGRPGAFLQTVRLGVVEDILVARSRIHPLILVMPFGSTGTFTDKEWANGVLSHEGWETFVARDLVKAVDTRYRTIPNARGRILGGLSEGGYAALNIGLHHPREFHVLESWSGYEQAANIKSIFGGKAALLRANSPSLQLRGAARRLRADHTYVWFYSGTDDGFLKQNQRFADALAGARIPHRFFVVRGGHNWALWRGNAAAALLAASEHIRHA